MIKLSLKRKAFGEKVVLENINITLEDGKHYIIEGPSGVGKTTLMRILSSLDRDFDGTLESDRVNPIVLFQENRLIENMALLSNLKAVCDDKERIKEVLRNLELDGELDSKVNTLSGGMKRRASIARSLVSSYDILFLDEPFTGLDESLIDKVAEYINKEAYGKTIVIISHDAEDKERFAACPICLEKE